MKGDGRDSEMDFYKGKRRENTGTVPVCSGGQSDIACSRLRNIGKLHLLKPPGAQVAARVKLVERTTTESASPGKEKAITNCSPPCTSVYNKKRPHPQARGSTTFGD